MERPGRNSQIARGRERGGSGSDGRNSPPPRGLSSSEQKYFGKNACLAIFDTRPEEIVRVYVTERSKHQFAPLTAFCAQNKKAFHIVEDQDVEKFSGSEHHQGVALIAKKRTAKLLRESDVSALSGAFVYLDGVENPHNFGAILRSSGYFNVAGVMGKRGEIPTLSGTACRTAEGAAEIVSLYELEDLKTISNLKRRGFRVIATSSHAKKSLYNVKLSKNTILVLGSEGRGISQEIRDLADEEIAIPGTGAVESLNVSAACAVLLGEYTRQTGLIKA